jgi:S-adenosylmethionine decarboxylase
VSGVAILAESIISVHTWPEIGYGAFDVFMCGDAKPLKAVGVLSRAFGTTDVRVKELLRGDGVVLDAGVAA